MSLLDRAVEETGIFTCQECGGENEEQGCQAAQQPELPLHSSHFDFQRSSSFLLLCLFQEGRQRGNGLLFFL